MCRTLSSFKEQYSIRRIVITCRDFLSTMGLSRDLTVEERRRAKSQSLILLNSPNQMKEESSIVF